jgi:hypothetical protein
MSLDVYLTADIHLGGSGEPVHFEAFTANVTHNLGKMAAEAGIYKACWRPEEIGAKLAQDLIEPLTVGLAMLLDYPERFRLLNPSNDWGTYDGLVVWVAEYLVACKRYPLAKIEVSR